MSQNEEPRQFEIDEKWDRVIDLGLRRSVYGAVAGALAALVLFRGSSTRAAISGIGLGFGAGSAYADSQKEISELLRRPTPLESDPPLEKSET